MVIEMTLFILVSTTDLAMEYDCMMSSVSSYIENKMH